MRFGQEEKKNINQKRLFLLFQNFFFFFFSSCKATQGNRTKTHILPRKFNDVVLWRTNGKSDTDILHGRGSSFLWSEWKRMFAPGTLESSVNGERVRHSKYVHSPNVSLKNSPLPVQRNLVSSAQSRERPDHKPDFSFGFVWCESALSWTHCPRTCPTRISSEDRDIGACWPTCKTETEHKRKHLLLFQLFQDKGPVRPQLYRCTRSTSLHLQHLPVTQFPLVNSWEHRKRRQDEWTTLVLHFCPGNCLPWPIPYGRQIKSLLSYKV